MARICTPGAGAPVVSTTWPRMTGPAPMSCSTSLTCSATPSPMIVGVFENRA